MTLEGAFNLNETYKRLLPGYVVEFYILFTIYEINPKLINTALGSSLVFLGGLLVSGVFFGAVFYLLAFDEICPVAPSSINEKARRLKDIIKNAGYKIPEELQDEIPNSPKKIYLQKFSSCYRDRLSARREDEYEFLVAQYQSYAQLAVISLTYAIVRFLIFLKFKLFGFTLDMTPPTVSLFLVMVFFGSGGFILFEHKIRKGLAVYIWSTRLGLCSLTLFLVLFIELGYMSFMTEIVVVLSAALGIIFFINYNTHFWNAYGKIISQFRVAEDDIKSKVCDALGLTKDTVTQKIQKSL